MYARLFACIPELALLPLQPDDGSLHDLLSQGDASSLDPDIPPPPLPGSPPGPFHQAYPCTPELTLVSLQTDAGRLHDLLSHRDPSSFSPSLSPSPPPWLCYPFSLMMAACTTCCHKVLHPPLDPYISPPPWLSSPACSSSLLKHT